MAAARKAPYLKYMNMRVSESTYGNISSRYDVEHENVTVKYLICGTKIPPSPSWCKDGLFIVT